ncbi:PREDICTED: cysteine-rich with EGF-like domain protein 2 isoform X2 [Nicrophorus vespilloides]|nr:PREDICTED: cysteine-rich with EGF-like domain protein 2 isoform X2 [Nicrophorus vespilloides]
MERTEKGKFEGGDAAWEEEKLKSYSKSEIRLVEIQEKLCSDVEEGQNQCYSLYEQHDELLEEWWFNHQNDVPDLFQYFCIESIQHCCPENHFGLDCKPCVGYPDNVCSKNGKCKGAGTRKGNGECNCNKGYNGKSCNTCVDNFFESFRNGEQVICTECHMGCAGKCTKAGPKGCLECGKGWIKSEEKGCLDLNECAVSNPPCGLLHFCVNTEGSYKCLDCDRSCSGCTGDGPDMCIHCASGFILRDNMCIDTANESRQHYVNYTRYCVYLGLCIATCIILQKNVALAAVIGLAVAIHISLSEYILNTPPSPNKTQIAEQIMRAANNDF